MEAAPASEGDGPGARAFLETFWGAEWPRIEEEMAAAGIDVDSISELPAPWEEIQREARTAMGFSEFHLEVLRRRYLWPDTTTVEELVERYGLTDTPVDDYALAEIHAIALEHQGPILDGIERYRSLAEQAIANAWSLNRVRRAPYYLPPGGNEGVRNLLFTASSSYRGWGIGYSVYADESPELAEARDELEDLRKTRDHEIREYLDQLR